MSEVRIETVAAKPRIRVPMVTTPEQNARNAKIIAAYGDSRYDAASMDKELRNWNPPVNSADADLLFERDDIDGRTLDLDRNEPLAHSGNTTTVDNVVGTGLELGADPDFETLGWTPEQAEEWSAGTEREFNAWWESKDADASRKLTGPDILRLSVKELFVRNDVVILPYMHERGGRMTPYGTSLMMVDSGRLSNPNNAPNSQNLRDGVEIDPVTGEPVAYHIQKALQSDALFGLSGDVFQWERIPAYYDWGYPRVIHLFDPDRIGQNRGVSKLARIISRLKKSDTYTKAELEAAVANALVAGIVQTPMDIEGLKEMFGGSTNDKWFETYQKLKAQHRVKLSMGALLNLFPGETFTSFSTNRPNPVFGEFMEAVFLHVCAALGIPREMLLKDFTKTTYSSARAAMLEAWRGFLAIRAFVVRHLLNVVYAIWLEEAVNIGRVQAPDFYAKKAAYCRCEWIGAGMSSLDPEKDSNADLQNIANGLDTYKNVMARRGLRWRRVIMQRAKEKKFILAQGLPDPSDNPQFLKSHKLQDGKPDQTDPDAADKAERAQIQDAA